MNSNIDPKEEFIHDYPDDLEKDTPWKENWYVNFIDRENQAWGINHISLMRNINKGRFSAVHVIDNQIIPYSNVIDISDLKETSDGNLTWEVIEPFKKFRFTFSGPQHSVDINYDALFPEYRYPSPKGDQKVMAVEHYRQAVTAKGTITKDGKTRNFECVCDRDHTWGYRNEGALTGWNWVGAYFPDRTINFNRILIREHAFAAGYVSTAEGNVTVARLEPKNTVIKDGAPVSAEYTGFDKDGNVLARIKTELFSPLRLPMQDKENTTIFENFVEITDLDTGEKGLGIDEYLIKSIDEYHENPGISAG